MSLVVMAGCSDSGSDSSSSDATTGSSSAILDACGEVDGTVSYAKGSEWTCDQIAVDSDARYGELTEHFTPLCAAPNELTSGWGDEAMTVAGWSCSAPADPSAGFATIEEACSSVGGTTAEGDDGVSWWCDYVPVSSDEDMARAEAAVAPFCTAPMEFRSDWWDAEQTQMQWRCVPVDDGEEEAVPAVDAICADLAGAFTYNADGGWTCRDVPINAPEDYEVVDNLYLPYCPEPWQLTMGVLSENPETAGWSCSPPPGAAAAPATIEEACSLGAGTFTALDGGGWRCLDIELGVIDNYPRAEAMLAPFCPAPLVLTSGLLSEDPPVAGWSCSPA